MTLGGAALRNVSGFVGLVSRDAQLLLHKEPLFDNQDFFQDWKDCDGAFRA